MIPSADFPQLPASVLEALQHPFSHLDVQLRPAGPREKEPEGLWFCQAAPFVPAQVYEARLNQIVPGAWSTLSPSFVVADDHLTLSVQAKIGPIVHTSYGEVRLPRLAIPDSLGEVVTGAPDAFSVAFIDACHRFGLGRYLSQLPRKWVPYDPERCLIKLACTEQRAIVEELYRGAGLPLDLPPSQIRASGRGETAAAPGAESHNGGNAAKQPVPLEDARARVRARDLARVKEQCADQVLQKILAKYRVPRLEDISEANLAAVIQWLNQRRAA